MLLFVQIVSLPIIESSNKASFHTSEKFTTEKSAEENEINEKDSNPVSSSFSEVFLTDNNNLYNLFAICVKKKNTVYRLKRFSDFWGDLFYPPPIC